MGVEHGSEASLVRRHKNLLILLDLKINEFQMTFLCPHYCSNAELISAHKYKPKCSFIFTSVPAAGEDTELRNRNKNCLQSSL